MVERAPDGVRLGNTLEHLEQMRLEALHSERDAVDAAASQRTRKLRGHRLGIRLDRDLTAERQPSEQALEGTRLRERRRAAAEKDRLGLGLGREQAALQRQLGEQRIDVATVLRAAADHGDEVAVAAPMRAEREMHVEVPDATAGHDFFSPFRLSTARNASCGTSTIPTCFIRFLPAFWRSSSLRLRVMSPP